MVIGLPLHNERPLLDDEPKPHFYWKNLHSLATTVSHVGEADFVHIGDTSAVKMVVMARPLLDLFWAGTRLKKHFMKSAEFHKFHMKFA